MPPKTIGEIRKLLGLIGYYRKYIPRFAKAAKPLTDLLRVDMSKKPGQNKGKQTGSNVRGDPLSSNTQILWQDVYQDSSELLIQALTSRTILAHPVFIRQFILQTNASKDGLGVVLY